MEPKNKMNLEYGIECDKYQVLSKIGQGTYGKVYIAKDTKTGDLVAIKKISLKNIDEGIPTTALREISLLKELNHRNIVKLLDVIHGKKNLTLVFEYLENDLKKVIEASEGGLNEQTIKSYLYQLLKGVQYIHKNKILHRDLKPDNLLISKDGILKIADFGLARGFGLPMQNFTNEVVTLWYRPPDILLGSKNYTTNIDIWGIGCILAEMVNGKAFLVGYSEIDQIKKIFRVRGTPNEKDWPELKKLPEWKADKFEIHEEEKIDQFIPKLSPSGIDLVLVIIYLFRKCYK